MIMTTKNLSELCMLHTLESYIYIRYFSESDKSPVRSLYIAKKNAFLSHAPACSCPPFLLRAVFTHRFSPLFPFSSPSLSPCLHRSVQQCQASVYSFNIAHVAHIFVGLSGKDSGLCGLRPSPCAPFPFPFPAKYSPPLPLPLPLPFPYTPPPPPLVAFPFPYPFQPPLPAGISTAELL